MNNNHVILIIKDLISSINNINSINQNKLDLNFSKELNVLKGLLINIDQNNIILDMRMLNMSLLSKNEIEKYIKTKNYNNQYNNILENTYNCLNKFIDLILSPSILFSERLDKEIKVFYCDNYEMAILKIEEVALDDILIDKKTNTKYKIINIKENYKFMNMTGFIYAKYEII